VGQADPANHDASTAREHGAKLTARLLEHAGTIGTAEAYTDQLPAHLSPIHLRDFVWPAARRADRASRRGERPSLRDCPGEDFRRAGARPSERTPSLANGIVFYFLPQKAPTLKNYANSKIGQNSPRRRCYSEESGSLSD